MPQILLHQFNLAYKINDGNFTSMMEGAVSHIFKNINIHRLNGGVCLQINNNKNEINLIL